LFVEENGKRYLRSIAKRTGLCSTLFKDNENVQIELLYFEKGGYLDQKFEVFKKNFEKNEDNNELS